MFFAILCVYSPPIGAPPSTWKKYENSVDQKANTFKCFDNGRIISLSLVNDGYSDCDDGSDEPGTSASQQGEFYCENEGYMPKLIPKRDVGDGICDCCDGSDEIFALHSNCSNTCQHLQTIRLSILSELSSRYEDGIKTHADLTIKGKASIEEAKIKKKDADIQISKLEDERKRIESMKVTHKHQKHNTNQTIQAKNESLQKAETPTPEPTLEPAETATESVSEPHPETLPTTEPALEDEDYNYEEEENKTSQVNETEEYNEDDEETNTTVEPKWMQYIRKVWEFTFRIPHRSPPSSPMDERKRAAIDKVNKQIEEIRNGVRDYEDLSNFDLKTDTAFAALYEKDFSKDSFSIKFMKEITESGTSLGHYKSVNESHMKFDGGSYCWQISKGRKTRVDLRCWNESKLVEVLEAKTCKYRAIFASPLVCTNEKLNELKNMTLEQLEDAAEKVGFKK